MSANDTPFTLLNNIALGRVVLVHRAFELDHRCGGISEWQRGKRRKRGARSATAVARVKPMERLSSGVAQGCVGLLL
ncbi:MAG: hypothetical protein ABI969_16890 [bacterium]